MADDNKKPAATFRVPDPGSDEIAPRKPADPAPQGVGDLLRRTREKHERSVPEVAAELNIRGAYLEALEQGRFDRLPGKTYAIGFLRSYADFLGLDSKDLVRRFKDEITGLGQGSQLVFPTPVPESRLPGGALILASLVLFASAYGAWSVLTRDGGQLAELVPAVPDHLQELVTRADPANDRRQQATPAPQTLSSQGTSDPAITGPYSLVGPATPADKSMATADAPTTVPAESAALLNRTKPASAPRALEMPALQAAPPSQPETLFVPLPAVRPQLAVAPKVPKEAPQSLRVEAVPPVPEAAVDQTSLPPETLDSLASPAIAPVPAGSSRQDSAAEIPAAPDTTQLASLPEPSAPQVYGQSNLGARIVLRAKQDSWIQVREGPEQLLISRVLQTGDSYHVPDRPGILLQTGNAGGIDVEVDGRNLGPFGAVGAVRRDVPLNPAQLLDGSAFRR